MTINPLERDLPGRDAFSPADSAARIDALERRGRIDALAGVWIAGAMAAGLAIALLDRVGAPAALCAALAALGAAAALGACGVAAASGRASRFHLAARALAAPYEALASGAALAAGAGLMAWPGLDGRPSSSAGLLGIALCVLLAPLAAWAARRVDVISAADLEARRFSSPLARRAASIPALASSTLLLVAGLSLASDALAFGVNLSQGAARAVCAGVVFLLVAPGGLGGVGFAAAGAGLAGLGGLAGALYAARATLGGTEAPTSLFGAGGLLSRGGELGVQAVAAGLDPAAPGRAVLAGLGLGIGLVLSPLIVTTSAGAPSPREAARAGVSSWPLLATGGALVLCLAALLAPVGADAWRDSAAAMLGAFSSPGLAGAPRGFLAAGALACGLALAGLGAQGLAGASGRDALFALRDAGALSSRRLAVSRLTASLGVVFVATALHLAPLDPRIALAAAAGTGAAGLAPPTLIALLARANAVDATLAALVGMAAFAIGAQTAPGVDVVERLGLAALIGACAGLAAGFCASLTHRQDPADAARAQDLRSGGR